MKYFNKNFLIQNFKKSKSALLLFIAIIPVLNVVSLLIMGSSYKSSGFVPNLETISSVSSFGLFILPFVLSISLFGFIFKKKSVDFVNSMPVSRKTIFVTNSIGGILVLIAMTLINLIVIFITNLFFPSIIINAPILVDYFILWTVSYIFVFTISNIATAVSGNTITSIIVSMLIMFFIPFVHNYVTELAHQNHYGNKLVCSSEQCKPVNYECYGNEDCIKKQNQGVYEKHLSGTIADNKYDYTTPYQLIRKIFSVNTLYQPKQILIMIGLSIIYFFVGMNLFQRRKMEVTETTFKSFHTHSLVKCLTLVPVIIFIYEILDYTNSSSFLLFAITLITIYFFVYDLITKKGITNFLKSIIYLGSSIIIVTAFCFLTKEIMQNKESNKYKVEDIEAIAIIPVELDFSYDDISQYEGTFLNDKNLINQVVSNIMSDQKGEAVISIDFIIKTKNGRKILFNEYVLEENYEEIINNFNSNEQIKQHNNKINLDNLYAIKIDDIVTNSKINKKIIELIENNKQSELKKPNNIINQYIELYKYKNHKLIRMNYNISYNSDLSSYLLQLYNEQTINFLNNSKELINYNINIPNLEEDNFVTTNSVEEIVDFIKKGDRKLDINNKYYWIVLYNGGVTYNFYTNDVEGVDKIINDKKEELKKNDPEKYSYIYNNEVKNEY